MRRHDSAERPMFKHELPGYHPTALPNNYAPPRRLDE
jgi:hypothetical protein